MTFLLLLLLANQAWGEQYSFSNIQLVDVYDGDTIKVNISDIPSIFGNKLSIRIKGIDTPEKRTKNVCEKREAKKATSYVRNKLESSRNITLNNCIRGKYFRLVCDIDYDGKSIAKELLDLKLAYPYRGKTKRKVDWCIYASQMRRDIHGNK